MATRLGAALEDSRGFTVGVQLSLTPSVEGGLRQHGGDIETGAGMDIGGGLVTNAATGRSLDVRLSGQVKSEWNGRLHSLMSGGRGLEWTSRVDGIKLPKEEDARSSRATGGSKMQGTRTVVGVDIAKRVFQLHWVDLETGELKGLRLTRLKFLEHFANRAPCLVGMEACGGAQHWARRLLALGHEVRLLPAKMVRPFVSGNKDDAHDAQGCGSSSSVAQGLLRAARQELLDPSKAWWGGRRGQLADRRCCPLSVSLGVVPLVLACFVEVPVRIEVAAGS